MHPLALAPGHDDACLSQIGQVTRYLGLPLSEDLDKVADAHLAPIHEIEQAQPGGVRQGCEEQRQVEGFRGTFHSSMVYALANMSSAHTLAPVQRAGVLARLD